MSLENIITMIKSNERGALIKEAASKMEKINL